MASDLGASPTSAEPPQVRPLAAVWWMVAAVAAVLGVAVLVAWLLMSEANRATPGGDRVEARLEAARIALAAGGGAGAGVGLLLAFRRQRHSEIATQLNDIDAVERRVTDRYTAAIDQLGSDKLDVRIGGIYALERLALDSVADHPAIVDVLAAFVREHAGAHREADTTTPTPEKSPSTFGWPLSPEPAADVQAALTVLGRRRTKQDTRRANLRGANLTGADLSGAGLIGARLEGALLCGANLTGANLTAAILAATDLSGADLSSADLNHGFLVGANLSGADLRSANLTETILIDANLADANLAKSNLSGADLLDVKIDGACLTSIVYDTATCWPAGFDPSVASEVTGLES